VGGRWVRFSFESGDGGWKGLGRAGGRGELVVVVVVVVLVVVVFGGKRWVRWGKARVVIRGVVQGPGYGGVVSGGL
jgi:hypothetical protein